MAIVNTNAKELHIKILYCGAEAVGKKSSLKHIQTFCEAQQSRWIPFPFEKELYGLIINIGMVLELQTYFHIYHLNNQSKEENQMLAKGSDGFVFIASLDPTQKSKNEEAFLEMEELILREGKELFRVPLVLQYNKTDLKEKMSLNQMRLDLNKYNSKDFQSSSLHPPSMLKPLKQVLKLCLLS